MNYKKELFLESPKYKNITYHFIFVRSGSNGTKHFYKCQDCLDIRQENGMKPTFDMLLIQDGNMKSSPDEPNGYDHLCLPFKMAELAAKAKDECGQGPSTSCNETIDFGVAKVAKKNQIVYVGKTLVPGHQFYFDFERKSKKYDFYTCHGCEAVKQEADDDDPLIVVETPRILVRNGHIVENDPENPVNGKHICIVENMKEIEEQISKSKASSSQVRPLENDANTSFKDPRRAVQDFGPAIIKMERGEKRLTYVSQKFKGRLFKFVYSSSQMRAMNQTTEFFSCVECKKEQADIKTKTGRSPKYSNITVIRGRIVGSDPDDNHLCLINKNIGVDKTAPPNVSACSRDFGGIKHCSEKGYENWIEFESRKFQGHVFRFIPSATHHFEDRKVCFYDCQACRKIQRADENFSLPYKNLPRIIVQNGRFVDVDPDTPLHQHVCVKEDPKSKNGFKVIETNVNTNYTDDSFGDVTVQFIGPKNIQMVCYNSRSLGRPMYFMFANRRNIRQGGFIDFFKCFHCHQLNETRYRRSREAPIITVYNEKIIRTNPDSPPNAKHFCLDEQDYDFSLEAMEVESNSSQVEKNELLNELPVMPNFEIVIEQIPAHLLELTKPKPARDLQKLYEKQETERKKRQMEKEERERKRGMSQTISGKPSRAETPIKNDPKPKKRKAIIESEDEDELMSETSSNKAYKSSDAKKTKKTKKSRVIFESDEDEEMPQMAPQGQKTDYFEHETSVFVSTKNPLPSTTVQEAKKRSKSQSSSMKAIKAPETSTATAVTPSFKAIDTPPKTKELTEVMTSAIFLLNKNLEGNDQRAETTIFYKDFASVSIQCKEVLEKPQLVPEKETEKVIIPELNIEREYMMPLEPEKCVTPTITTIPAVASENVIDEKDPDVLPKANLEQDLPQTEELDSLEKEKLASEDSEVSVNEVQNPPSEYVPHDSMASEQEDVPQDPINRCAEVTISEKPTAEEGDVIVLDDDGDVTDNLRSNESISRPVEMSQQDSDIHVLQEFFTPTSTCVTAVQSQPTITNSTSTASCLMTVPPSVHYRQENIVPVQVLISPENSLNAINARMYANQGSYINLGASQTVSQTNGPISTMYPAITNTLNSSSTDILLSYQVPRRFALTVKHTYLTTQRQIPVTKNNDTTKLVETPHSDVLVPYKPPYDPQVDLTNDARTTLVSVVYKHFHEESVEFNLNPNIRHIFFVDSLFFSFNHAALKNACVLRTEFPTLFKWSRDFLNNFRFRNKPNSCIFYGMGFDLLAYFKHQTLEMILKMVKDDLDYLVKFFADAERLGYPSNKCTINRKFTIVFITIPEIGTYKSRIQQFNDYMRKAIFDYTASKQYSQPQLRICDWSYFCTKALPHEIATLSDRFQLLFDRVRESYPIILNSQT